MLRKSGKRSNESSQYAGEAAAPALSLRRLGPGDVDVLASLARDNSSFDTPDHRDALPPLSSHEATAFLSDERTLMFVAFADEQPVGFCYACVLYRRHTELRHLCVYEIGVSDRHRNMGIGQALLEAVSDHARSRGISRGFVITQASDGPAMSLYEQAGGVRGADDDVVFGFRWDDDSQA